MFLIHKFNYWIFFFILLCYNILFLQCLPTNSGNKIVDENELYVTRTEFNQFLENVLEKFKASDEFMLRYNHGVSMQKNMNLSVDPCDNFYEYACGNWDKYNPIPKDEFEYQVFFSLREQMRMLIKKSITSSENLTEMEKIAKLFYSTCMDVEKINERSTEPLLKFIEETGGWPAINNSWSEENFDLLEVLVRQQKYGLTSILTISTNFDVYNSSNYVLDIKRNNIPEHHTPEHKIAYSNLISQVLQLLGVGNENSTEIADEIINFENEPILKSDDYTDFFGYFVPSTLKEIINIYPDFDWNKYFNLIYGKEIDINQKIILHGLGDIKKIMIFLNSNKRVVQNYIAWRNVYQILDILDDRFTHLKNVYIKSLNGKEESERWKVCIDITSKKLGWLTSSIFIKASDFDEGAKKELISITEEIRNEFLQTLKHLDWIDDDTKKVAELKVNSIKLLIGYPDLAVNEIKLRKYYDNLLPLEAEKFFENYLKASQHEILKHHNNLNKKVNREKWFTYPAIVDAFYHPVVHVIVFPAGVLQLPLYHKYLPKALKYARFGSAIGHELTHGFDTTGRLFDYEGNMRSWWSNSSIDAFTEKTECFHEQYDKFSMHGKDLSGFLSSVENIADNGGIRQAFSIYTNWLNKATPDEILKENIPNVHLTDKKLFFLGYAQTWCSSIRVEAIEQKMETDSHPPGIFRVLGALHNSEEFSETFNCPKGSPMNPTAKCRLW